MTEPKLTRTSTRRTITHGFDINPAPHMVDVDRRARPAFAASLMVIEWQSWPTGGWAPPFITLAGWKVRKDGTQGATWHEMRVHSSQAGRPIPDWVTEVIEATRP